MKKIILVLSVFIAACGITPVHYDGKTATYQHHEMDFSAAMNQAKEMCAKDGKGIRHEKTDCHARCRSTFSCVDK